MSSAYVIPCPPPTKKARTLGEIELDSLGTSAETIQALLREGSSPNTIASYRAAVRYWAAWHEKRLGLPFALPVPVRAVVQFIADHVEHADAEGLTHDLPPEIDAVLVAERVKARLGPLSLATVRHRLAVLSEAHETKGLPNPCRSRAVQTLLSKTRVAYARRGVRPAKKPALTREPLEQLLATCDASLIGLRDRALLLFAWASGGRRRSEVAAARMEYLRRIPEGFLYTLAHSKTRQDGADRPDMVKPLLGPAAEALTAWLEAANITDGPIFRQIRRGGAVQTAALSGEAIRRMVAARAVQAGLEERYAAHSLRSGFITEAGRQAVPLAETMAMSGHASVNSVAGYHRVGAAATLRAARLLAPEPSSE